MRSCDFTVDRDPVAVRLRHNGEIGMLAFTLPCGVGYDPVGTVASMIPGILASGVALRVISHRTEPGFKRLAMGAVLMGAGIGLMHYSGMAAMQPEALLRYDPMLVLVSVVVAVGLAFVSLGIRFRLRGLGSSGMLATLAAAPVMGFAVAGMHYTAMQASIFFPLPDAPLTNMAMSPMFLAAKPCDSHPSFAEKSTSCGSTTARSGRVRRLEIFARRRQT